MELLRLSTTHTSPRFTQTQSPTHYSRVSPALKPDTFARTGTSPHPYLESATENIAKCWQVFQTENLPSIKEAFTSESKQQFTEHLTDPESGFNFWLNLSKNNWLGQNELKKTVQSLIFQKAKDGKASQF